MGRNSSSLFILVAVATLLGCEPAVENASIAADETAVLPGTESSRDFGDYVVHFNAILTEQLAPEIAREYGIVRSRNRMMLNVSILKKVEDATGTPVSGAVSASTINLTGQFLNMAMREIREGTAIYYIGEQTITDGETLIFTIDVTPLNEASRFTVRLKKQFFVD